MEVKIKKLDPKAVIPKYAKPGDAGMDLTATSKFYDDFGNVCYGTGIAFEIPEGFVGLLFPRSSICKQTMTLSNAVGVLDSGFRAEVSFKFKPSVVFFEDSYEGSPESISDTFDLIGIPNKVNEEGYDDDHKDYEIGDRIGQIIILPYPKIEFVEVDELSETERGIGGYGSTGN